MKASRLSLIIFTQGYTENFFGSSAALRHGCTVFMEVGMKEPVGFIGLGNMGMGMARSLLKAGFPVVAFDIRKEPLEEIRRLGGAIAETPLEVARRARVSILVVLNFVQAEEVVFGNGGMKEALQSGDVIIVSSTIAPGQVKSLGQKLGPFGVEVLDAPISGGKEGAEAGTLSIMIGGQKGVYERCLPLFQAMGKNIYYLGGLGNGLSLKLVNNLLVAVNNLAVAEAMSLGIKAGLDPKMILEVIPKSAGDSWMFRNRANRMVDRDFACRGELDILLKDLGFILEMGKALKMPLTLSAVAKEFYQMANSLGLGKEDDSAVFKVIERMAGFVPEGKKEKG
jgi:3-hydroxyisobutyrate dehydrogenase-like beta-hydroxyacid dehydrogenase